MKVSKIKAHSRQEEDKLITIALAEAEGDRKKAAKILGISSRNLYYRIKKRKEF